MPATKAYTRVNFENYPSTNTPLNETNLNKLDKGIDGLDDLLVTARNNIETLQSNATTDEEDISNIQSQLTASNQTAGVSDVPFRFGCTDDGKFGYILTQGGADSVVPFSSDRDFTMKMTVQIQGTACYEQYSTYNTNPGQGSTKTTNITVTIKRTNGTMTRSFSGWDGGYASKYNGYVTCRIASITITSFTWDS